MDINLHFPPNTVDFILNRLIAGQMDWQTSQILASLVTEIQRQANDPALNPKELREQAAPEAI